MTTVSSSTSTGGNPYGDQSGIEPDWQAQKNTVQSAYDSAVQKLQSQREGTLQQYGFTASGDITNPNAQVSFDPQYQNSIYGNAMRTHGNTLQQLRTKSVMRGLDDYGLGAQDTSAYQDQAARENEGIKSDLLNNLSGGVMQAADAGKALRQGLTDVGNQQGLYGGWAKSHYVSEGGSVRDPYDAEVLGNNITTGIGGINFKDKIAAGATLGRVRDSIKGYLEQAGLGGYNTAQAKQYAAQYQNALRKAGLDPYDPKWAVGGGLDLRKPVAKAKPKGGQYGEVTPNNPKRKPSSGPTRKIPKGSHPKIPRHK